MKASRLLLASIAAVLVLGGVALALLSTGPQPAAARAGENGHRTSFMYGEPEASPGSEHPMLRGEGLSITSCKKITLPPGLLRAFIAMYEHVGTNASKLSVEVEKVSVEGSIETAYDHTLVLSTEEGSVKIIVSQEWRIGAAKYDLLGLFAEGTLAKGMNVKVDAVKLSHSDTDIYVLLGYRITLPDGTILESGLPING